MTIPRALDALLAFSTFLTAMVQHWNYGETQDAIFWLLVTIVAIMPTIRAISKWEQKQ